MTPDTHAARISTLCAAFDHASARFLARYDSTTDDEATRVPTSGGWTPAQIAAHVAALNRQLAAVVSGRVERAMPPSADFVERPWPEVASRLSGPLEAPASVTAPVGVSRAEARVALISSSQMILDTYRSLSAERARLVFDHARTGPVSLYQVVEWLTAHVARHNAQMKTVLGR